MKKGMDIFHQGTRWSVSWDSNINFWLENWTSKGPLRSIIHGPLRRVEEEYKVGDIVTESGWDWEKISLILPNDVVKEIRAMLHARVASEEDRIIWAATSNGQFNLNSAYLLATQSPDSLQPFKGN